MYPCNYASLFARRNKRKRPAFTRNDAKDPSREVYVGKEGRRARRYRRSPSEWHERSRRKQRSVTQPPSSHLSLLLLLSQVHCPLPSSAAPTPVFPGTAVLGLSLPPYAHERHFAREYAPLRCPRAARAFFARARDSGACPGYRGPSTGALSPCFRAPRHVFFDAQPPVRELRILSYGQHRQSPLAILI